ncbi:MAG: hypothetical protein WC761_01875 [Candidatus Paceibacterota bacterium]|jgi:hypothetical protein
MKPFLFILSSILIIGCGAARPARPSSLDSLRQQFAPIETIEPEVLDTVVISDRDSAGAEEGRTYRIVQGEVAPYTGLLLNDPAAAYIVSEYQALGERYGVSLTQQRERDYARLIRDTESMRLQINGDRERFLVIVESQDQYINNLEGIAFQGTTVTDVLVIVGAGAVGIVIGIIVGFFAAN